VGRKEGWWAKVPSKMVNSAVGDITSSRLIRADFSAKRAACVRKPAGKASFSYSVALRVRVGVRVRVRVKA
jgi:hypothetical protein